MQKTILITGCSSGIGHVTCHYLRTKGYKVLASARKEQDVQKLKQEGFEAFQLDVSDSKNIDTVINEIKESHGNLYALCNNAGYAQPGALEDINKHLLRQQFETNVFGLQELTNHVLPIFRKQGEGRIIHIGSLLGMVGMPFRGAYNASKYAVEGLADTLRLELRNTNIFVSIIEPGPIRTQFRDNALLAYEANIYSENSAFKQQYHRFLTNFIRNKHRLRFSLQPEAVARRIHSALESPSPKPRYYVTIPTYLFSAAKRLLPQRLLDLILANIANQEIN